MRIPIEHNPVTDDDLQHMLRLLSGIDGHPRSPDDIDVWLIAAHSGGWTRAQVAAATLALSRSFRGFRIMPGHVDEQIAANRDRIRALWYCPDPPRELADDPAAELAWRRRAAADFAERALFALATGRPLEDVPLVLDPEPTRPEVVAGRERLRELCDGVGRRKAVPAGQEPVGRPMRRVQLDPTRRAQIRAELDARRSADSQGEAS